MNVHVYNNTIMANIFFRNEVRELYTKYMIYDKMDDNEL